MSAAILSDVNFSQSDLLLAPLPRQVISAAEFRDLIVSHRRMVRLDLRGERLKGLRDLDTGEIFVTDERRLLHA